MSFRHKLGIAFFSILFPTVLVALVSWWGMGMVLNDQEKIFKLSREIEQRFFRINIEEELFAKTHDLRHSSAVSSLLEELNGKIGRIFAISNTDPDKSQFNRIEGNFEKYRQGFSDFSSRVLNLQTIESRLALEAERLQTLADGLLFSGDPKLLAIHQAKDRMLFGQKEYLLFKNEESIETLTASVQEIGKLAREVRELSISDTAIPLKVFRIARQAALYEQILRQYIAEKDQVGRTLARMRLFQETFSRELVAYIDLELARGSGNVSKLRLVTIAVSVFVITLSIMVTLIISARITRPINQLKKSATDIVNGNLDTVVEIDSNDEIGQLGEIFNRMTQRLKTSFEDRDRYRDHLEELVSERTKELQKEIDERTQAEQALRTSESQLSQIIEQSPMAIILSDMQLRVMSWNRTAEKIFNLTAEEAVGRDLSIIVPPETWGHVVGIWQRIVAEKNSVRSRNENFTKDGRVILCDWSNVPLYDADGAVIGVLSLAENVTDQSRMEQELLKIKKLESTGVLAGGIAHDFNNILTAILGNLSLSLLDKELSPATRSLLESAEKASWRAKNLTLQLLTFAKGGEPIRESTSLAEVIRDSANFVLHGSNVTCHYDIPADLWHVHADKGQISQVIQNIVINARQATPKGGHIVIACANVAEGEEKPAILDQKLRYITISIQDSGEGIAADVLDSIFDPYFSTKQDGSGLGLAITLSIISKHEGHILVDSAPGKGTRFAIFLPAVDVVSGVPGSYAAAQLSTPRSGKILLMDDEDVVLDVLRAMLERLGYQVICSHDGQECLDIYRKHQDSAEAVDLVIVDLTIPGGIGGREVLRQLLDIDPKVKVVVSSGYSNDPVMATFRQHGFCGAISKPYMLEDVSRVIDGAFA